ncbi:MAG TPA: DUF3592 domain-containing protein [Thermoanaerobaculia bacterium]
MRSQAWRIAVLMASVVLSAGCVAVENMAGITDMRELQSIGDPAEAEILRVWDTGMTLNDDPVIGMEVEVQPLEGERYRAVIPKSVISRIAIPRFQPGALIAVRYDPRDLSRVGLDDPPFPEPGEEPDEEPEQALVEEPEEEPAKEPEARPESASGSGFETTASAVLRLCARSREPREEKVQIVFLVTGPGNRRYEHQKIAPMGAEPFCADFPGGFEGAWATPGIYRYEIRIEGEIAEMGELELKR